MGLLSLFPRHYYSLLPAGPTTHTQLTTIVSLHHGFDMIKPTNNTMSIHTQLRTGARPMTKDLRDEYARPSSYTPRCPNLTPSRGRTEEILGHRLMTESIESQGRTEGMYLHLTAKSSIIKSQGHPKEISTTRALLRARPESHLHLLLIALCLLLEVASSASKTCPLCRPANK